MILLADLGNRSLSLSIYENRQEKASFKTLSDKFKSADEYQETLRQFLRLQNLTPKDIDGAILASVVPSLTKRVEKAINTVLDKECLLLDRKLKTGLAIRMDNPSEVGSNLISAAIGAIKREMNSAKWTWFAIGYQCAFAYFVAMCVYQIGMLISGTFSVWTVVAFLLLIGFCFLLFRPYKESQKLEIRMKKTA